MKLYQKNYQRTHMPTLEPHLVLGVDPSKVLGFALLSFHGEPRPLQWDSLRLTAQCRKVYSHRDQEAMLTEHFRKVLREVSEPDLAVVEVPTGGKATQKRYRRRDGTVVFRDFQTPTQMVIIGRVLEILERWVPTMIVSPSDVKRSLGLSGIAPKEQVEPCIKNVIDCHSLKDFDTDADKEAVYDALAIAWCGWKTWQNDRDVVAQRPT